MTNGEYEIGHFFKLFLRTQAGFFKPSYFLMMDRQAGTVPMATLGNIEIQKLSFHLVENQDPQIF